MVSKSRLDLYRDRKVHLILSYIVNAHEDIRPIEIKGNYSFPNLEKILGGEDPYPILEDLAENGILKRYPIDNRLICPKCGSRDILTKYLCPFCNDFKIKRGTIIEHYNCANVALLEDYLRDGDLFCPKCGKEVKAIGIDYKRIENIYHCDECKKEFNSPKILHNCLECDESFDYETAEFKQINRYNFNEDLRSEVIANSTLEVPITNLLKKNGYSVESPGVLVGDSGVEHYFDIIASHAKKGGKKKTLAITIASPFLSYFGLPALPAICKYSKTGIQTIPLKPNLFKSFIITL